MPPPCPTSWGQGFTTWSQHGRLIPSSKSGQKSGFNPSFSTLATNHSNNHRAWANLTGKVQPTDHRFSTSIWEEAEPSKDMRRPGRGRKMRRQHAGRNKDIQSQLRRNSQASTGTRMTKGQHFKMRRVKEWSAGKGELETVTSGFQNWNP